MESLQGRTLGGRYQIVEPMGHGGAAQTYRAIDRSLGRDVAVKVFTDRDGGINARLLAEARSAAELDHPGIAAVYDAGEDQGFSYIVMEPLRGKQLAALQPGELGYEQALRFVCEILDALEYAHSRGVTHRNLKPSNVTIVEDGEHVKLTDIGLARRAGDLTRTTPAREIAGMLSYLAPERGSGKPADARSDLYSVGILMHEMFRGRDIPAALKRIMTRAIEREPELRYQTARDFRADVAALPISREPRAPARAHKRVDALENVLKGMIATRRRKYDEARDAYQAAMRELRGTGDDVEYAKTALKFGAMVLQKAADGLRERDELREAVNRVNEAVQIFDGCGQHDHRAHAEHTLHALERTAVGVTP